MQCDFVGPLQWPGRCSPDQHCPSQTLCTVAPRRRPPVSTRRVWWRGLSWQRSRRLGLKSSEAAGKHSGTENIASGTRRGLSIQYFVSYLAMPQRNATQICFRSSYGFVCRRMYSQTDSLAHVVTAMTPLRLKQVSLYLVLPRPLAKKTSEHCFCPYFLY